MRGLNICVSSRNARRETKWTEINVVRIRAARHGGSGGIGRPGKVRRKQPMSWATAQFISQYLNPWRRSMNFLLFC